MALGPLEPQGTYISGDGACRAIARALVRTPAALGPDGGGSARAAGARVQARRGELRRPALLRRAALDPDL